MKKIKGETEDKIWKVREFVSELSKVQDKYYEDLVNELGEELDGVEDFLFDYVYNNQDYEGTFEEYLAGFSK